MSTTNNISATLPTTANGSVYSVTLGGHGGGGYYAPSSNTAVNSNLTYAYTGNGSWNTAIAGTGLVVQSDAEIKGSLTVAGKDIMQLLDKIEERLAILHPNPELEERWEELKELSKRYRELEAEIIEKEKVWSILKK